MNTTNYVPLEDSEPARGWSAAIIDRINQQDRSAWAEVTERFWPLLEHLADRELAKRHVKPRDATGADIVCSALGQLWADKDAIRINSCNREGLLGFLAVTVFRKAGDQSRKLRAQRRGSGKIRGESVFVSQNATGDGDAELVRTMAEFCTDARTSEEHVREAMEDLLSLCYDDQQRAVVELRMASFEFEEIAERLGRSIEGVKCDLANFRKLYLAREAEAAHSQERSAADGQRGPAS